MNELIYISIFAIFLSLLDGLTTYLFLKLNGTELNWFVSILIKRVGNIYSHILIFFLKIFGIILIFLAGSFEGLILVVSILMLVVLSNIIYSIKLVDSNKRGDQSDIHIKRPITAITPPSPPEIAKAGVLTVTNPPILKADTTIPIPTTVNSICLNLILHHINILRKRLKKGSHSVEGVS